MRWFLALALGVSPAAAQDLVCVADVTYACDPGGCAQVSNLIDLVTVDYNVGALTMCSGDDCFDHDIIVSPDRQHITLLGSAGRMLSTFANWRPDFDRLILVDQYVTVVQATYFLCVTG